MSVIKRLFLAAVIVISGAAILSSCEEDPELPNTCTGCPAGSPYSKDGVSCYASQNDCEAAQGAGCVVCN